MAFTIIGLNIPTPPGTKTEMEKATIDISNRQSRYNISHKVIRKISQSALDALGYPDSELSIVLVDDPRIATINRDYLHRDGPTNVIAFSMREGPFKEISPDLLGDVVISLETASVEARNADLPLATRFCQLLIHGILHLLGYDHENSKEDAARMEIKSREVLRAIMASIESEPGFSNMITVVRSASS